MVPYTCTSWNLASYFLIQSNSKSHLFSFSLHSKVVLLQSSFCLPNSAHFSFFLRKSGKKGRTEYSKTKEKLEFNEILESRQVEVRSKLRYINYFQRPAHSTFQHERHTTHKDSSGAQMKGMSESLRSSFIRALLIRPLTTFRSFSKPVIVGNLPMYYNFKISQFKFCNQQWARLVITAFWRICYEDFWQKFILRKHRFFVAIAF